MTIPSLPRGSKNPPFPMKAVGVKGAYGLTEALCTVTQLQQSYTFP